MSALETKMEYRSGSQFRREAQTRLDCADFEAVVSLCRAQLSETEEDAEALHFAAIALRNLNEARSALDFHALALQQDPMVPEFHLELGKTFMALRLWTEAASAFDIATKLAPSDVRAKTELANCLLQSGHPDGIARMEAMLQAHPKSAELHYLYGVMLCGWNRKKAGRTALKAAWTLGMKSGAPLYYLVKHSPTTLLSSLDPMLDEAFARDEAAQDHVLHFAKAEREHRRKRYDVAYRHFAAGNAIEAKVISYDPGVQSAAEDATIAEFSAPLPMATSPGADKARPIFIVGMPRSGSTLCETILAAHSQVTPLGEIGEIVAAVRRLDNVNASGPKEAFQYVQDSYLSSAPVQAADTPWVVDKHLGNRFCLGYILHAFPDATVIHVHRDPRAAAWSMFRQVFARGEIGFAYQSADIRAAFDVHTRLMQFWTERYGDRIIHLSYEDLVERPQTVIPDLLDRVGLTWEVACLSPEKVTRMVATASSGQTTKAIYRGSSDVWRNYAPFSGGWLEDLPQPKWPEM